MSEQSGRNDTNSKKIIEEQVKETLETIRAGLQSHGVIIMVLDALALQADVVVVPVEAQRPGDLARGGRRAAGGSPDHTLSGRSEAALGGLPGEG